MNKSDLVGKVAETAKASRQQVEDVLDAFFDTVRTRAKGGDRIAWPGFGSFSRSQRKARTGRNPRTGEAVKIPATKAVKFSPSSTLKDYMNSGSATKAAGAKKSAAKKAPAKKAPAKKAAAKKAPAKKAAAKKAGAAKSTKKAGASKAPAKKAAKSGKR